MIGEQSVVFFQDSPVSTAGDLLNFSTAADHVKNLILTLPSPIAVALVGAWGSGKTSLMKMAYEKLSSDKRAICAWFDPWIYEKEENLVFPLLSTIEKSYPSGSGLFKELKVIGATTLLALVNVALKATTDTGVKDISEALRLSEDAFYSSYEKWVDGVASFREDYEMVVAKILGDDLQKRLVVFIDDLDRCFPENIIRFIESVKNFLTVQRCVYVFGIDKNVVLRAITAKYSYLSYEDGCDYFDKIFQVSLEVPDLDRDSHTRLMQKFLVETELLSGEEFAAAFPLARGIRYTRPRNIKRLANNLAIFKSLVPESFVTVDKVLLLKWFLLLDRFKEFADDLSRLGPNALVEFQEFSKMAPEAQSEKVESVRHSYLGDLFRKHGRNLLLCRFRVQCGYPQ